MGMTGFSDAEMALLSGLDAVAWVTRTRITYKDSFKREAVTRYRRPHAPAADAGREGRPAPMSVVLAQTMRINALEERLRRLELSMADGTAR